MIYDLQRASMWKRISAFLFDVILFGCVAVLLALAGSAALRYDRYQTLLDERYAHYAEQYGVSRNITEEEMQSLPEEDRQRYDEASAAIAADSDALWAYNMLLTLIITITSLSLLFSFILMEFAVPMALGNGQTLGKKIFGVAVMRTDGVKVNGVCMFIRTVLGKYVMETMLPLLLIAMLVIGIYGEIAVIGLAVIMLVNAVFLVMKDHTPIHDRLASTITVDLASQMIFKTHEDMIAYKTRIHAEEAAKQSY